MYNIFNKSRKGDFIELDEVYTISEITDKYDIKKNTIYAYLNRGEVIPEDKVFKKGNVYLIEKEWIDEKYKDKLKKQ